MKLPGTPFLWFLPMFTSILRYEPGSGTLELRIRFRIRLRIHNTERKNLKNITLRLYRS
jgi:hypothetical protein